MVAISVIIPIYNVEQYIAKCLDSVLSQPFADIEIICVNDSSPDNSREIVIDYQKKHRNIILIDRENGGLSAARNTGIKNAKGKYLIFLDSDDYLSENILTEMYQQMEAENLDILLGNIQWVYETGKVVKEKLITDIVNVVQSGEKCFNTLIETDYYVPMAYNSMIRSDFLVNNNLYFKEGYVYEDEMWTPEALLIARRVNGFYKYHYNYFQRTNTIVNSGLSEYKLKCLTEASDHLFILSKRYSVNATNTKANLIVRACVIYGIAKKSYPIQSISSKNISGFKLLCAHLPKYQFDICIQNIVSEKISRRLLRFINKSIC